MAQQAPIVFNEIFCYIKGVRNMSTVRQIHESVISLFNMQELGISALSGPSIEGSDFKGKHPREEDKVHFGLEDGG